MSDLTPMQSFCLVSISREAPIQTAVLRSDIALLRRAGQGEGLDENKVFRTLRELVELELIVDSGSGWVLADVKPVKVGQLSFWGE